MKNTKNTIGSSSQITIYETEDGKARISVRFENENVWLTQKLMAELFECSVDNVSLHLKNIFAERELERDSVVEEYSITAADGKSYKTKHYSLEVIILSVIICLLSNHLLKMKNGINFIAIFTLHIFFIGCGGLHPSLFSNQYTAQSASHFEGMYHNRPNGWSEGGHSLWVIVTGEDDPAGTTINSYVKITLNDKDHLSIQLYEGTSCIGDTETKYKFKNSIVELKKRTKLRVMNVIVWSYLQESVILGLKKNGTLVARRDAEGIFFFVFFPFNGAQGSNPYEYCRYSPVQETMNK
jgi:hypothetical protein